MTRMYSVDSISGGKETIGEDDEVKVGEPAVREVLSMAFSLLADGIKWDGVTKAMPEYLAAPVLADHMTSDQTMSLIVHPYDPARKLVPSCMV